MYGRVLLEKRALFSIVIRHPAPDLPGPTASVPQAFLAFSISSSRAVADRPG
jgi:hypothetical protein